MQFFSLWKRASRTPATAFAPEYTAAQIQILKDLVRHPGWKLYVDALDSYSRRLGEGLLVTKDTNTLFDLKGEIRGIRNSPLLIAQVLNNEELNDERRTDAARTADAASRYTSGPYA